MFSLDELGGRVESVIQFTYIEALVHAKKCVALRTIFDWVFLCSMWRDIIAGVPMYEMKYPCDTFFSSLKSCA
jgi:hypothetical protein